MAPRLVFGALAALSCALAAPAFAQQPEAADASAPVEDSILVLDASGSMWAQIDGVARITIAREVILDLLDELPANRRLGLVAYGHNRKGDCSDIETLVEVGTDRDAIREAIKNINPKGKTPMTAAVRQAAEALKYSENKATVILVSDGLETCGLDPCAVTETLEATGVGLTVHTVGFGLGDDEKTAKAQLRCMAANTGGISLMASDAEELTAALQQVSAATVAPQPEPEPEPEPPVIEKVEINLTATDQDGGPVIEQGLVWTVRHGASGEVIFKSETAGQVTTKIPRGVHDVTVKRLSDGATASGAIETGSNGTRLTLPIIVELAATVEVPATAPAGSGVRVVWTGPDEDGDYIAVTRPDAEKRGYLNYTRTRDGNPLIVQLPDQPGSYEIRYISQKTHDILARQTIEATGVEATLEIPASAPAGSVIEVTWTGPDYEGDFIAVAPADSDANAFDRYTRTRDGNPLELRLPDVPGAYVIRYFLDQSNTAIASQPITTTAVEATLDIPATAPAGSAIEVSWTGPDYDGDFIAVAPAGSDDNAFDRYTRTRDGNPLELRLPDVPGEYVIRYFLDQTNTAIASQPITTTAVEATLDIPASAPAGSVIEISWTGPDYDGDFIAVAPADSDANAFDRYTRTRDGNPLELRLPEEPGEYVIRYFLDQTNTAIASQPITVGEPEQPAAD